METVKLTKNEKSVLVAIVANAKQVGDNGVEFILADVAEEMGKNIRSISATAGSLAKKGMLLTANGDSYFDGELTEAGLHEVEESDKVNQEVNNNKNQDNMEDKNFDAPVMDERIVKLNELKSVKMAALSKSKRPAAKEAKGLAAYVLNNWDNQQALEQLLQNAEEEAATELGKSVLDIAQNRRNQMNAIKIENGRKEAEKRLKAKHDAKKVYKDVNGVEIKAGCRVKDLSADGEETEVFEDEGKLAVNADGTTVYLSEIETDKVLEVVTNKKQAPKEKKADKSKKDVQPKEKAAKTARKVGDVHPKHPTWVWTEYAPGKFDWRTNPKDKKQGQRTDMADKKENKQPKSKAADKKAAKGKEAKQEAPKKAEKPIYTIDEWVALPTKPTTAKSKMSEAQKEAFKLINKGYRITADKKFFENDKDDRKSCNWASVEAMLKRYGIDYVPMGLIKEDKNEK